ncbi:MAG: protein kinase [Gemmataceae bacterium]
MTQSVMSGGQAEQPTLPPNTTPPRTHPQEPETLPPESSPSSQAVTQDALKHPREETLPGGTTLSIPGYEILSELGRGGMGVIYKARQHQPRRFVALKMILTGEYANSDELARFQAEAEAVAKIQHPNIVKVHQVAEHQGHPYLTLEYVDGGNLAQYLKETQLGPRQAALLVLTLADAIHKAHKKGIIHRDLKPANILLSTENSDEALPFQPKVADFGLAKQLEGMASVAPAGPKTQSGAIMGTPSYMAPEQAAGKTKMIGPETDIYALGAILYELLTGNPPFQGGKTIDVLLKVTNEDPVPPRQLAPDTPRDLETICLKCLQKEPKKRYQTAKELADDLDRHLDGQPIKARPQGTFESFTRWLRKRKEIAYLAIGSVAALGVIGLVIALSVLGPKREVPQPPVVDSGKTTAENRGSGVIETIKQIQLESAKVTSTNNLRHIGLALHGYHDTILGLPFPAVYDKQTGRPLLSWRVKLLPYLDPGLQPLYHQFRLNEPWDSPHNKKLLAKMPEVYEIPWGPNKGAKGVTCYQAIVGPKTAFEPPSLRKNRFGRVDRLKLGRITDGTSNTLAIVEAATPVEWTKPADIPYDPQGPLPKIGGPFREEGIAHVCFLDGSVLPAKLNIPAKTLRALIEYNDGMLVPNDWRSETPRPKNFPLQRNSLPPKKTREVVKLKSDRSSVNGRLTYQGKPVPGAVVTFHRSDNVAYKTLAQDTTEADGSFQIKPTGGRTTGTPRAGGHVVTIALSNNGKSKIPAKYADVKTSPLRVELRSSPMTVNFDLK